MGDPFEVSTAQDDESDIFRGHPSDEPSNPSARLYSTRARGLSSGVRNPWVQEGPKGCPGPVEISPWAGIGGRFSVPDRRRRWLAPAICPVHIPPRRAPGPAEA